MSSSEINNSHEKPGQDELLEPHSMNDRSTEQTTEAMLALEKQIVQRLMDSEADLESSGNGEKDKAIRRKLAVPYEIRIQTERDPIVEETNRYRQMAQELDDRYDRYMERTWLNCEKPVKDE